MKNLLFAFFFTGILCSFSIEYSENEKSRRWWEYALADAAGALGGAGSVASIASAGSATPPGAVAIAAGALVGGAGASIALSTTDGEKLPLQTLEPNFSNASNSDNKYDNIGKSHNEIVIGFASSNMVFNVDNYIKYIKSLNNSDYNNALKLINKEYLENEFIMSRNSKSTIKWLEVIKQRLPKDVEQNKFINELNSALKATNVDELLNAIVTMETKYLADQKLSKTSQIQLASFFSTLRFSSALWK